MSARATGNGMDVDTSLFDVALHNLNYPGTWFLNARRGHRPHAALRAPQPARRASSTAPAGRLDLHHVQQGEVLGHARAKRSASRMGDRPGLRHVQGAAGEPRSRSRRCSTPRSSTRTTDGVDRALRRARCRPRRSTTWRRRWRAPASPSAAVSPTSPIRTAKPPAWSTAPIRVAGAELPTRAAPPMGADTVARASRRRLFQERIAALDAAGAISLR